MSTQVQVQVWAHDSGQRLNWAYSFSAVKVDQQRWYETFASLNNYPHECVGSICQVPLADIDENDVYVGWIRLADSWTGYRYPHTTMIYEIHATLTDEHGTRTVPTGVWGYSYADLIFEVAGMNRRSRTSGERFYIVEVNTEDEFNAY